MNKMTYDIPIRKRSYSLWQDVIFKNKYVFISIIMSAIFITYAIDNLGMLDSVTAVENFTYEQVRFMYVGSMFIMSLIPFSAITGAILFLFSGRIRSISVVSLIIYIFIGMIMGWFKFIRDLIRLPFNLIIWISTKISKKQYENIWLLSAMKIIFRKYAK
ncbi:hypothetical protein [Aerococcus urinaeequi]|uniref:hypothetical protein n=1 Tax=Aerococcus urinaeequi TaxID=51665 RepID=UPI00352B0C9A